SSPSSTCGSRRKTVPDRRAFMLQGARAAGGAPLAMALLEGHAEAVPRGEGTRLGVLCAAVTLAHHAVAPHTCGLRGGLFPAPPRTYAGEFRGDHVGHRDTQVSIAGERGGRAPEALRAYDFEGRSGGPRFVREALEIELAAQRAYSALISGIATRDYMLSA